MSSEWVPYLYGIALGGMVFGITGWLSGHWRGYLAGKNDVKLGIELTTDEGRVTFTKVEIRRRP